LDDFFHFSPLIKFAEMRGKDIKHFEDTERLVMCGKVYPFQLTVDKGRNNW